MHDYSLTHLSDAVLLRDLSALIKQERILIAAVIAHIAEVDARKLFVPLGYSSMFVYCVEELRLSDDAAYKRIQAARAARQFPILFGELADGRLHLTAVCLLAPHLTAENVDGLVRAAAHRRQSEIHDLLACCALGSNARQTELAARQVEDGSPEQVDWAEGQLAAQQVVTGSSEQAGQLAAQQVGGQGKSLLAEIEQLVPVMVRPATRDRLRYVQALLSHAIASGDVSEVLDRALDLLIEQVEKRRFGTGSGPRRRRAWGRTRYIPAEIRHAVWNRDQGRCTFVGTNGHRCDSNRFLEFDHVDPHHPEATVSGLRLRCRAHNQYEAERIFGTEFMARKRKDARRAAEENQSQDVLSALRGLGIRGEQARRALARAEALQGASLEERIRAALQFHGECVMHNPRTARLLAGSSG